MIEVPFHKQGKGRVWFNEATPCYFSPKQVKKYCFTATPSAPSEIRRVAAELWFHSGGFFPYGLLGAVFTPDTSDILQVEVFCNAEINAVFENSLASGTDDVMVDLPCEYTETIVNSLINFGAEYKMGGGLLCFDSAAYGEIGSSQVIFARISLIVVRLLLMDASELNSENLALLFSQE